MPRIQIEAMARDPEAAAGFLAEIREGMLRHNVYRGQLLALGNPHGPFGEGRAMVEFLAMPEIERNEVILPGGVLKRVERHTVRFTEHARTLLAAWTRPPRYLYPTPNAGGVWSPSTAKASTWGWKPSRRSARTEGTSASFIKELPRRATLFAAEEEGVLVVTDRHVGEVLDELLVAGGTLTTRLSSAVNRHRQMRRHRAGSRTRATSRRTETPNN
jgi:hypothetical protein